MTTPASCPVAKVPWQYVNLEARVQIFDATPDPYIGVAAFNNDGLFLLSRVSQGWFCETPSCGSHISFPQIRYPMATGSEPHDANGEDRIEVQFDTCTGDCSYYASQWTDAYITYRPSLAAQITHPGIELLPHTAFTISASLHDPTLVSPVSLTWILNGSPLAETTEVINGNTGEQGTWFNYEAIFTDATGATRSGTISFYTKLCDTPGCADMRRTGPTRSDTNPWTNP